MPSMEIVTTYLTDHISYVTMDEILLSYLSYQVLQGSILGPLLFLIYVNDLPLSVRSASCFLFADDTKLLHTIKNEQDQQLFQDDIHQLKVGANNTSYI